MRVDEALRAARDQLSRDSGDPSGARLDAEILLSHLLQRPRTWLHAWPEHPLDEAQQAAFAGLVQRRRAGVPIAYLTGQREFWSLEIEVTPATLIPRPETELLVEEALRRLAGHRRPRVLELGTGSGCIACALAHERPNAEIIATDRSGEALAIAARNLARHAPGRVELCQGDWFENLDGRHDLILSNPPYIAANDPHLGLGDLPAEPREALVSGADGLDAIRQLVADAPAHLRSDGWLLFEHGHDQGARARALLHQRGYREITSVRDLAGIERVTLGRAPPDACPE